jgi:hypothetical protein
MLPLDIIELGNLGLVDVVARMLPLSVIELVDLPMVGAVTNTLPQEVSIIEQGDGALVRVIVHTDLSQVLLTSLSPPSVPSLLSLSILATDTFFFLSPSLLPDIAHSRPMPTMIGQF